MQTATDRAASAWLRPEFARLLAILWVAGLALIYLVRYDAWALPSQALDMLVASWPGIHVGPQFHEFWRGRLRDGLCLGMIVVTALGLGAAVTAGFVERCDVLGVLLTLAVGLWALAVLTLVVGALSVARIPYVFLALACWFLPAPRKFIRGVYISTERTGRWGKLMVACVLLAMVLNLVGAMTPPFEYDALEYHLGALADYQRAGRIVFLPHNFYSNMPQLTEMLYLVASVTTSDVAAKLLHWLFGVLGALAVYGLAQRLWSKSVGVTAAALFYCTPFVQDLSQTARIDLATALFATLAFGAGVLWAEEEKQEFLWLSALCAGAAVATKWPAVPIILLPVALMPALRRKFGLSVGICLISVAMVSPWLVKNWWLAGNPVYPLFNTWFPNPHWSVEQAMVFARRHSPTFDWSGLKQLVTLPWTYSFTEPGAAPLLLMTTPLILLVPKAAPAAKRLGWLFIGAYGAWYCCTFRPWRFLFPAFGVAAVAAALAMEKLGRDAVLGTALRLAVGIVLMTSLAALGLNDLADIENPERVPPQINFVRYDLGQFTRGEFVSRIGKDMLEPIVWMNEYLPGNAKLLYVGEARAYYARNPVVWSTAFDQNPLTAMSREAKSPEELLAKLRERGITHVYVNFSELDRLRTGYNYMVDANWGLIRNTLENDAREVHQSGRRIVYELAK